MKYLEALRKKNLSVQNLPKTLQKKIEQLNFQYKALNDIEETPSEDLQESDLDDIEVIKESIKELDSHIEHKVNIFDQVKYDEKLAKISKMTKAKKELKKVEEVEHQEVDTKEPEIEVEEPVFPKVVAEEAPKLVQAPVVDPTITYVESAHTPPIAVPPPAYEEEQEEQEEEEFERKGDGNPKKMTTGLILMGVGAFFLTWGAVNFFKSRR